MRISDETKLKLYPVAIGIMGLGLVVLLFTRIDIILPTPPPQTTAPIPPAPPTPSPTPTIEPSPSPSPSPTPVPSPPPASPSLSPTAASNQQGSLKVSNQTLYPVRVVLLFQQASTGNKSAQPSYKQPVHWDFAPGEGGNNGLLLSLPDGNLQVKPGDILLAFAEDGSRRYWGPYVVGRTGLPDWNGTQREWTLLLQ